jgi:hypothetical protein
MYEMILVVAYRCSDQSFWDMAVFLVMRAHNIPGMKRQKMENGLVSAMIHDYMAATTSTSSQRLASFLGDDGVDDQLVYSAVDYDTLLTRVPLHRYETRIQHYYHGGGAGV